VLTYSQVPLTKGNHRLTFEIIGANPEAIKSHMVAIDYLRLVPASSGSN